ncbi:MAG: D-aminoacylase, partial [Fulvivirga sp.]
MKNLLLFLTILLAVASCGQTDYDTILKNGLIYDGSGDKPYKADVAIKADTVAAIGDLSEFTATEIIDLNGLAVAPGFINMLSWANTALLEDGRSQGDIRQGV